MNDFGSSAWSAVVTVSTTKKPQTSEDLQRAVTKGDVETVKNILPGKLFMLLELIHISVTWSNKPLNVLLHGMKSINYDKKKHCES